MLGNNVDAACEEAQKYANIHPGLYLRLFEMGADHDARKMLAIRQDSMNRINSEYCIRSRVALATAQYDLVKECYLTAYESDTNAVNYLRALLNCVDSEKRNRISTPDFAILFRIREKGI